MFRNKFWLVMGICLMVVLSSSDAFAWRRGGPREVVVVGHNRYHYRDGRFYRPGWFGFDFVVVVPPIGAVITVLPPKRTTIIVKGVKYYYYDNVYYSDCPSGYIVVPAPATTPDVVAAPAEKAAPAEQPQAPSGETVVINIPNAAGGYTPVTLVKDKDGYIGPQGEYYQGHPTVDQLKVLYGN